MSMYRMSNQLNISILLRSTVILNVNQGFNSSQVFDVFDSPSEGWAAARAALHEGIEAGLAADDELKKETKKNVDAVLKKYGII